MKEKAIPRSAAITLNREPGAVKLISSGMTDDPSQS
jgi:hypothetical protein